MKSEVLVTVYWYVRWYEKVKLQSACEFKTQIQFVQNWKQKTSHPSNKMENTKKKNIGIFEADKNVRQVYDPQFRLFLLAVFSF